MPTMKFLAVCRTALQVAFIIAVWFGADRGAAAIGLPFSGGVVGLLLLVTLLLTGVIRPGLIELGADWLLANMLLFFVPLVVSVVQFTRVLESEGIKLFIAIGVGFISVLVATALTVEWVCRFGRGRRLHRLRAVRELRESREFGELRGARSTSVARPA
jgi:holin-like protein